MHTSPTSVVNPQGQCVLVTREHWAAVVLHIAPSDARFFCSLQAGHSLAQALDAVLDSDPQFDPSPALGPVAATRLYPGTFPHTPHRLGDVHEPLF